MRYIHIIALLVVLLTTLTSCSPDVEKEDGILIEMGEDGVTVTTTVDGVTTVHHERTPDIFQPEPEPQPDWADNVITLTIGRFNAKEGIVAEFRRLEEEGMIIDGVMKHWLTTPEDFRGRSWEGFWTTPPENAYTVGITLISMQDAGFKEPATIAEVRDRIIQMGFEPITFEEAYEIRLQLKDQPSQGPWSYLISLPMEEEIRRMAGGKEVSVTVFNSGKKYGVSGYIYQAVGPGAKNDELIIPSEEFREQSPHSAVNPSFACAIPETRRKK